MQSFERRRSGALASLYSAIAVLTAFAAAAEPPHDFAAATRGDRASGWLAQSRSEVLARNGIVTTSQPLAAQAGLQVLKKGGNAFDAAAGFPANVNVAAALALAGIGPVRTRVEIWADPGIDRNVHTIRVEAEAARFSMTIENVPSVENPRTGQITALSMLACLRGLVSTLKVGT